MSKLLTGLIGGLSCALASYLLVGFEGGWTVTGLTPWIIIITGLIAGLAAMGHAGRRARAGKPPAPVASIAVGWGVALLVDFLAIVILGALILYGLSHMHGGF